MISSLIEICIFLLWYYWNLFVIILILVYSFFICLLTKINWIGKIQLVILVVFLLDRFLALFISLLYFINILQWWFGWTISSITSTLIFNSVLSSMILSYYSYFHKGSLVVAIVCHILFWLDSLDILPCVLVMWFDLLSTFSTLVL